DGEIFLGREISQHRDFSEETARQIDAEVRMLVDNGYQAAHSLLENNQPLMHRMSQALLERETLDAAELKLLVAGKDLPPMQTPQDGSGGDVQHVLKPDAGHSPGFAGEQPSTA
ncbi:MAG: cell division protein FtsH, partial [Acidobacteriaceae bacterium]